MPGTQASPKEVGGFGFCRNWKVGTLRSAIPGMGKDVRHCSEKGRKQKTSVNSEISQQSSTLARTYCQQPYLKSNIWTTGLIFFCLTVLKECLPFQSSWSVFNLPFTDWQNFVLKSLVPWFLPILRRLEGGQIFFHSNSFHIALLSGKLARGVSLSLNQNKFWLSFSRKRQCGCWENSEWINVPINVLGFGNRGWFPACCWLSLWHWSCSLTPCIKKGWAPWTLRLLFVLLFYDLMIHRRTLEGKSQWDGPPHQVWWTPCDDKFPSSPLSLISGPSSLAPVVSFQGICLPGACDLGTSQWVQ